MISGNIDGYPERDMIRSMNDKDRKKLIEEMKEVFPTAEMVKNGFDEATKGRHAIQNDLAAFKQETQVNFAYANSRLDAIEANTKNIIHRDEFDDLMARVKYVETKLGIESGK